MVRDIMGLMEILSFLYAFAATYRAKVKCNIYTVVFAVSQLIILSGMNNHGMTEYLLGLSYVLMFLYCLLNYKEGIKRTIINCVLGFVEVAVVQIVCYFVVSFGFEILKLEMVQREILVTASYSIIIVLTSRYMHLDDISDFFMERNWLLRIVGIFILMLLGSQIWSIKRVHMLDAKFIFLVVYFALVLILMIFEWEKTKNEAEKKRVQLELNHLYYEAYEGLIQSIRDKQHDFKNHLNAIEGLLYSVDEYSKLVEEQKTYIHSIVEDIEPTKLLTKIENPLIAGFLNYKVSKAIKNGIEVRYDCIFPKCEIKIPEYQIVEMMGIICDNAYEEMSKRDKDKIIVIKLFLEGDKIAFFVANPYQDNDIESLSKFFERGYSSKGKERGIGLAKLKRMINENRGDILISQEELYGVNMIRIGILINI